MLTDYPYLFPIILILIAGINLMLPIGKNGSKFLNQKADPREYGEYDSSKTHNITLASFSIVVLAVILSLGETVIPQFKDAFSYLSLSMFCFFVATYMFNFRNKRWFSHIGNVLEMVGIISLATGFLYLVSNFYKDFVIVDILYGTFFGVMVAITAYDLYLNKKELG